MAGKAGGLYQRGAQYWARFVVDGTYYRKPLNTTKQREAVHRMRELIEQARAGSLTATTAGPKTLFDAVEAYLTFKRGRAQSPRTPELEGERLAIVKVHFKDVRLSAITATAIQRYQQTRKNAGISNRTINMDVGALSRLLKHVGRWRALEQHVEFLSEPESMIGRALTGEEQQRLFGAAASNPEWDHVYCAAILAANTSMRPVEVKHLRRQDVDLFKKVVVVRRSKLESSHRVIPLNAPALKVLARMVERADTLGFKSPEHYLWFACKNSKLDPTQPIRKWDTAWRALRNKAGLPGLRFHDLRHTIITELAEAGVPDLTIESIAGHVSRKMLEHYSHIRLAAKRQALDALDERREQERQSSEKDADTPKETPVH